MAFRRRNKSYPFFSQEFLIQNHADIVFGLVIFILIGLMFEVRFSFFLPPSSLSAQLFSKTVEYLQMWLGVKSKVCSVEGISSLQTGSKVFIPDVQTLRTVCVCAMGACLSFYKFCPTLNLSHENVWGRLVNPTNRLDEEELLQNKMTWRAMWRFPLLPFVSFCSKVCF